MEHLPIFMNIKGRPCLVVGGGEVAARKAQLLLKAGARVQVSAKALSSEMDALLGDHRILLLRSPYSESQLAGKKLVIAATDDSLVNRQIHSDCVARNIPVNVVDCPELCTFMLPAMVERGPVTIAVSSAGQAPVLSRLLRARLETLIPASYGLLAELAGRLRAQVKARFDNIGERRRFWESVLDGPIGEMALAGRVTEAEEAMRILLAEADTRAAPQGEVYLIGAGPGDPDLLTFRALRLLQKADVIVYDRLVGERIVDLGRREAQRVYVGKRAKDHTLPQEEISALLVRLAQQGLRVARLKGGDPFVFGRGGEEIQSLAEHGLPFQVVPGITAATGCAAYAGIPLTHRDYAQSVRFITGHTRDGRLDLDWANLACRQETLVFYMGLQSLPQICSQLIAHGLAADLPAAVIEQGTTPGHRVLCGTLATLSQIIAAHTVGSPSLLIIGDVVRLHDTLGWYKPRAEGDSVFPLHRGLAAPQANAAVA